MIIEQLEKDSKKFSQQLDDIVQNSTKNNAEKIEKAAKFACSSSTQVFCSKVLENSLASEAGKIHLQLENDFIYGSVLHILSASFDTGGHTQVVARWIDQCTDLNHDIMITRQKIHRCANSLKSLASAGKCSIESLHGTVGLVQKARALRLKASKYQYIVLHIHMDDIIPSLAFATSEFNRPVFLFNHADHLFWVGAGAADLVLETREWGKIFSNDVRGIENNCIVGLPSYNHHTTKHFVRDLPPTLAAKTKGRDVILSSGLPHKYVSMKNNRFPEICDDILDGTSNTIFIFVGINVSSHSWCKHLEKKFPDRIFFIGVQEHWILIELMKSSKLYLDSSPMSGGTALYDAVRQNVACLSYKSVTGHLDPSVASGAVFEDSGEIVSEAIKLLSDDKYRKNHIIKANMVFKECGLDANWASKLAVIMRSHPKKSGCKVFASHTPKKLTELDVFIAKYLMTQKMLFRVGSLFSLVTWKYNSKRNFKLNFLHLKIVFNV